MKPLHEDQIHAPAFQKLCDFTWAPNPNDGYIQETSKAYGMQPFNSEIPPAKTGVIFIGMCQLIERCFESIPSDGKYIVVHRTNDRSFTQAFYRNKPQSVKHIYTVDCEVNASDVSAIPIGFATIGGEDELLKRICEEQVMTRPVGSTKLFCRYNINPATVERIASLSILKKKSFAKVVEEQIPEDEFYREIKAHDFTMALAGCGKDACRQWDAIALGSIPIVSDCIEMRHFEDLPLIFCPKDVNDITEEWLAKQYIARFKSTERMRMSYWEDHLNKKKQEIGI